MISLARSRSSFISRATISTAALRSLLMASVALRVARSTALSVFGFSFSILPLATMPACTCSQSTGPSLPGMLLLLPVKYSLPPASFMARNVHGAHAAIASMSPLARGVGARSVPADVDLEAFLLEVAELIGDGELRRHLRIAHEPRVDLAHLRLLGEGVGGGAERDESGQHGDLDTHERAPFIYCRS